MKLRKQIFIILLVFVFMGIIGCSRPLSSKSQVLSAQEHLSVVWKYDLRPGYRPYWGSNTIDRGVSVVSRDGIVYFGTHLGKVVAVRDRDSKLIWERDFGVPISAGPILAGESLYIANSGGVIERLDRLSGQSIWSYDTGAPIEGGLSVGEGLVVAVNANNRIYAVDLDDGSLIWKKERARVSEFAMYGQMPPLIKDGVVYAGFSDGSLSAYAVLNGTVLWFKNLSEGYRFKDVDSEGVIVDSNLYVASSSSGVYSLSKQDGKINWKLEISGASSVQYFQGDLYVSSVDGLYRIRAVDGAIIWHQPLVEDSLLSSIALGQRYIYCSIQRLGLAVVDRRSGELRHIVDLGSNFSAKPIFEGDYLYVMSNESKLYKLLVRGGI